jgi:hypothetical protein
MAAPERGSQEELHWSRRVGSCCGGGGADVVLAGRGRLMCTYIYVSRRFGEVLWDASNLRLILSGDVRNRLLLLLDGLRPGWLASKPSRRGEGAALQSVGEAGKASV